MKGTKVLTLGTRLHGTHAWVRGRILYTRNTVLVQTSIFNYVPERITFLCQSSHCPPPDQWGCHRACAGPPWWQSVYHLNPFFVCSYIHTASLCIALFSCNNCVKCFSRKKKKRFYVTLCARACWKYTGAQRVSPAKIRDYTTGFGTPGLIVDSPQVCKRRECLREQFSFVIG